MHKRQKWGGVLRMDVVEGERKWQVAKGGIERERERGLYDGCGKRIGGMRKLVRSSKEAIVL